VDLGYAQYQGTVDAATDIAVPSIRYAAPPLGDLCFRVPQIPPNMTGVQPATAQPNECFQTQGGNSTPPRDLPTVVWIHGGGYGSSQLVHRAGGEEIILQSNRGIVVVVIQHRLGVF
ncbi:Alpha/Beta hydrolase protein, partial [Mycena capillaripes]